MDCISYIGGCSLSMVSEADLKIGRKYIIHADWKADEPYCFPLYINRDGVADVSAAIVSYFHNLQAMREIVAGAIDKPTILSIDSVAILQLLRIASRILRIRFYVIFFVGDSRNNRAPDYHHALNLCILKLYTT